MGSLEELERRVEALESVTREVAVLRAVVYGVVARLDELDAKVDILIEGVASHGRILGEQSRMLADHGRMLQVLIDRGA